MICMIALSYTIVYWTGLTSYHNSVMTRADETRIRAVLKDKSFRRDHGVYQVLNLKSKPRRCK